MLGLAGPHATRVDTPAADGAAGLVDAHLHLGWYARAH
jgi:hypothetical protein